MGAGLGTRVSNLALQNLTLRTVYIALPTAILDARNPHTFRTRTSAGMRPHTRTPRLHLLTRRRDTYGFESAALCRVCPAGTAG